MSTVPVVKYQRFPLAMTEREETVELPDSGFLQVEVIDATAYVSAIYQEGAPFVRRTITFMESGDACNADHVSDLGLVILPLRPPRRVVMLGVMPPHVRAAREALRAGIVPATAMPRG